MAEVIDFEAQSSRSPSPTEEEGGLFGDGGDDEEDGQGRGAQSDDDGAGPAQRDANSDEEDNKKKKRKSTKPKGGPVRRMLISEDILSGRNGLTKIEEIFKDFQFRGKGKEKEDLSRMLNNYEHWIHTMHPKHPFDQSLERIEFLGLKRKPVKTLVKRIRMGLISSVNDNDDRVLDDDDDEVENTNLPTATATGEAEGGDGFGSDDELDIRLISELESGISGLENTRNQNTDQDDVPNEDELLEFEQIALETQNNKGESLEDEMDIDTPLDIDEDIDSSGLNQMATVVDSAINETESELLEEEDTFIGDISRDTGFETAKDMGITGETIEENLPMIQLVDPTQDNEILESVATNKCTSEQDDAALGGTAMDVEKAGESTLVMEP